MTKPEPLTDREVITLRELAHAYEGAGTAGRLMLRTIVVIGALAGALAALIGLWHVLHAGGIGPTPPFSSHN